MDETMLQFQEGLIEVESEAEKLLLACHELIEIDRLRNGNREALTALRKKSKPKNTRVPLPFESTMKVTDSRLLVKEACEICGCYDSREKTMLMFPGMDVFLSVPFHAAHTILEKDQELLDYDSKKQQSYVKEQSFSISEKGALADRISLGVLRSLVALTDKPKTQEKEKD